MPEFFHGIKVTETTSGVFLPLEKSTAVIGLVATATAAAGQASIDLDAAFPLDTPVLVTNIGTAIGKAGTGGTLKKALQAIADQGSPIIVVVRVDIDADPEVQEQLVIGDVVDGAYTGLQAFRVAEQACGVRPRILGAPGLDDQAVVAGLVTIAQKLRGFVYASCRGAATDTVAGAVAYRAEFSARELMLIWPEWTGFDGQAVAAAMGKRAALDQAIGWHQSISNQPINGVVGISKTVGFDMFDSNNDAGVLNQAPVTTLVRRDGYRLWGNRTCSDDAAYAFEVATRTSQIIQDAIAEAEARFLDRPMTVGLVRDIVETANAKLASWIVQGRLIGGKCWYNPEQNSAPDLAAGKLAIDFDFTPVAPAESIGITQTITDKYYLGFASQLGA